MSDVERMIEQEKMEPPATGIPLLHLPSKNIFKKRGERFSSLARKHPDSGYLGFLALLSEAQHKALGHLTSSTGKSAEEGKPGKGEEKSPLTCLASGDYLWINALHIILEEMKKADIPAPARNTIAMLMRMNENELEVKREAILDWEPDRLSPAELPFIAASVQVYQVNSALLFENRPFGREVNEGTCPVCASPPVCSVIRAGSVENRLRYLCCSLCGSEWHMVRIKCASCGSTGKTGLYSHEGSDGAIKAESCHNCNSYLKILYLEKDPDMDPVADDLATLSLDIMMDEEGLLHGGANLFLLNGGT